MLEKRIKKDIVIAGGGLAGICAAISAARLGKAVALIQNRSVLGGNSSSEIRVWVSSATKHGVNRYARETGIMGELFVENQYRNIDGNPYIWDALLLEKVKEEKNIELFLNTEVTEVECENKHIQSLKGFMIGAERRLIFEAPLFADCTGDGLIGFLAGAEYMLGRESKSAFSESLAPDAGDNTLMGSTLLFYTRKEDHPVNFVAPSFAKDISKTSILKNRVIRSGDSGANYWWIEWGGEKDVVHDDPEIRDELLSLIYGIWDYIKNSGEFEADDLTLEWVGTIPGKREYRRLIGDYILKQQDIECQQDFEDAIGFGGWSIDLHPSKGIYNDEGGAYHAVADGIYPIPYRMLISKDIDNLFMAGRDVSTTHVAFGGIRVMATCALMGEAVGTAASIAVDKQCLPRDIYKDYLTGFQQLLLKNDASLIGISSQDEEDIVRKSAVSASNYLKKINTYTNNFREYPLVQSVAVSFPVAPHLSEINLLLSAKSSTKLTVELWDSKKPQNYIPENKIAEKQIEVKEGELQWIDIPIQWVPEEPKTAFVIIRKNEELSLFLGNGKYPGVLSYENDVIEEMNHPDLHVFTRDSQILHWTTQGIHNKNFIFKVKDCMETYNPEQIINGLVRPYGGPNTWTTMFRGRTEWIQFDFERRKKVSEVRITFDDDVNEDLINLHHHYTENGRMPELVKDFRLLYLERGVWKELNVFKDNRKRHHVIHLDHPVVTDALKLEVMNTNGSPFISIYEVRAYGEEKK